MLSCEVVSDLMPAYASGEASEETRRLVEEHLSQCRACREAYGEDAAVESALEELAPGAVPANGERFVARTRRLVFAVAVGALTLFAAVLVAFGRVVMEDIADIPLPRLPGTAFWLVVSVLLLALYAALLLWRSRRERGGSRALLIVGSGLALLGLLVSVAHVVGVGSGLAVLAAAAIALAALGATFFLLPRLAYAGVTAAVVLVLLNGLLVGQVAVGALALGDFSWQTPAALGHPAEGQDLREAARVDLSGLGLERVETAEVAYLDMPDGTRLVFGPEVQTALSRYVGDGSEAYVVVARLDGEQAANRFFTTWREGITGPVGVYNYEVNLPAVAGGGRILRNYSVQDGTAYSGWQVGEWVTLIHVPGPFARSVPLAREIKEAVAESYGTP